MADFRKSEYRPSRHVRDLFENSDDDDEVAQAFVEDVIRQRLDTNHADFIHSDQFQGNIETLISRATAIAIAMVSENGPSSIAIEVFQEFTDHILLMPTDAFIAHYDLEEILGGLDEALPPKIQHEFRYLALAAHLNPANLADRTRQLDQAILDTERRIARHDNFISGCLMAGGVGIGLGIGLIVFSMVDSPPSLPLPPHPVILGCAMVILGILAAMISFRDVGRDRPTPAAPPHIAQWLRAHGAADNLVHWASRYWPWQKYNAHHRRFWRFSKWRRSPCPPEKYPRLKEKGSEPGVDDSPYWAYLETRAGKAASRLYCEAYEDAEARWFRAVLAMSLAIPAVLFIASLAFILSGRAAPPLLEIATILAMMAVALSIILGRLPAIERAPRWLKTWWFRKMPPESSVYWRLRSGSRPDLLLRKVQTSSESSPQRDPILTLQIRSRRSSRQRRGSLRPSLS